MSSSLPLSGAELPKNCAHDVIEEKWYRYWIEGGWFHADERSGAPPYCIVIPPPNVTGALHVGHGLVNTLQDVLIRWARMRGQATLWVPGTDHAGIATQHVVAESLRARGLDHRELGREKFLEHAWQWKEQFGGRIIAQLKRLGCSCDWEREAFTLDEARQRAVRAAFKRLFDKGLIYRGKYLINWDPSDRTALSDDEVEYDDEKSHLWHIRYPYEDGPGYAVVATTRPETMLGDTAVAVNPADERYRHLIGRRVILPLMNRPIPIIADDYVKREFGTGMVKITPAHDPNDFMVGLRHNLEQINIFTESAVVNENGGKYRGLDRYEARRRVVEDLQALGLIEKIEPHEHRVGRGYRSKAIIEPRLSPQWFVRIEPLAAMAREAVRSGRIRIVPKSWETTYFAWMDNVRDWCISRQLWWGHRIPIWYRKDDPARMICFDGEGAPPEVAAEPDAWEQDPDVLDTWFSSALWPFSTLGWPEKTAELQKFYPTSVLVTAHDILFFWVARMIMMGLECADEIPFHDVFLHGLIFGRTYYERRGGDLVLIRDPQRIRELERSDALPPGVEARYEKVSKSKGNAIDPVEIIEEFGADAFRLTITAYAAQGRAIELDHKRFEGYRNFVNKLWNASRFVMMNTAEVAPAEAAEALDPAELEIEDRWILSLLARLVEDTDKALRAYEFDTYVSNLYQFTWRQFCDWYLEIIKPRFYAKDAGAAGEGAGRAQASRRAAQKTALFVLDTLLRLFHPAIPFVTEEIWQTLKTRLGGCASGARAGDSARLRLDFSAPSLCVAAWPALSFEHWGNAEAEARLADLQAIVTAIRNVRAETGIPPGMKSDVALAAADAPRREWLASAERLLRATVNLGALSVAAAPQNAAAAGLAIEGDVTIQVMLPAELLEQEKARLDKEIARLEQETASRGKKLSNAGFVDKAPAAVVEAEREKLASARERLATLREKRAAFGA